MYPVATTQKAAIALKLNILESAIIEVQEWAKVLWVRFKGGCRFVSKKLLGVKKMVNFQESVFNDLKQTCLLPEKYEELMLLVKSGSLTKKEATICYAGAARKYFEEIGRKEVGDLCGKNYSLFSLPFGQKLRAIDFAEDEEWIANAPNV